MNKYLTNIQIFITIIFPFIVLHLFSSYFYNLSLTDILTWWGENLFTGKVPTGMYLLGLFFSWLVLFLTFSGFFNILYLTFFGKKQEMVYLGHASKNIARYYDRLDYTKSTVTGLDVTKYYNTSFDDLFRSEIFIRDIFQPETTGARQNRLGFIGFMSVLCALLTFLIPSLLMFNVITYSAYSNLESTLNIPIQGPIIAFDYILAKYGLSSDILLLLIPVLSVLWLIFSKLIPTSKRSAPLEVLPNYIFPGAKIFAIPTEVKKHISTKYSRSSSIGSKMRKVDSGYRYINFLIEKGFSKPVFISTCVYKKDYEKLMLNINHLIKHEEEIELIVNDDLSISLP